MLNRWGRAKAKWAGGYKWACALFLLALTLQTGSGPLLVFADEPDPATASSGYPPGASVRTQMQVASGLNSSPFDTTRYLNLPPNFSISVYARVAGARFMAITPDGNLLVSQPGNGKVSLVRPNSSGNPIVTDFVTGLYRPHDMVFHTTGNITYLYLSEANEINRYIYNNGDSTAHDRQIVVDNLPYASLPELKGSYAHELKNIAVDSNDKLYVSIGSTCNACTSDTVSDPLRAAIYQYNADGTGGRLFAKGLRNAEGLAFIPGTNNLWVAVNNRDNIACPTVNSGEGCNKVGDVSTAYVDNHPPEEFTAVRDGGNYGWPFCNPNPDTGTAHVYSYDNMPFDRDNQLNADGSKLDCSTADHINKGIQAHSAPLGLTFLQDTNLVDLYRNGALIALHGSWDRSTKTGYKIIYFPWDSTNQIPGPQIDLVTGWLDDSTQSAWGRPVDTAVDPDGNIFISDDQSGTVYKLSYNTGVVTSPTDDGSGAAKTLSYALKHLRTDGLIQLKLSGGASTLRVSGALPPVPAGTILQAPCVNNRPSLTLDATGVSGNLVLNGNVTLHGVQLKGFGKNILQAKSGINHLSCVVVRK